ncbi:Ti-type conjugative transfer relaxase TraA [Xanthomonas citri pv. citri]|nr:Ti-type conjugative transfer relaxase TraA [Xanthomonas citri pv. citri]
MAIYHLSAQIISRKAGRSATAAAAYRSGSEIVDERTGEVHDYSCKQGVLHSEIVMPQGCKWQPDRAELWNAVELKNKRADAQVARDLVVALPHELPEESNRGLLRSFSQRIADRYGVGVDYAMHAPDKDGDERNLHGHILLTTNKIGENGKLGNKARELDGIAHSIAHSQDEKRGDHKANAIEGLREEWAELVNAEMERHGFSERIDHRSHEARGIDLEPTKHVGVQAVGMDRRGMEAERVALHEETRRENAQKIEENPSIILDKITSTQAVFDRRDMARELHRHIDDPEKFQNILVRVERDERLVQLAPERTEGGRTIPAKYSTQEMIDTEQRMVDTAERMAGAGTHGVDTRHVQEAIDRRGSLSDEQRQAVERVTEDGRMAVVIGDAGTGKSFAMATAREAWEAQGYRVRGAALAGKAADELQAGSGIDSRTLASLEYGWKEGRDPLTSRDVLVIDEAGMVGSRQLGRVLDHADKAGAKVVLLGDDKQLPAIEAGAGFRAITERRGAAEITEIRRQRESWAKEASGEFARGDVRTALDAYAEHGGVRMVDSRDDAKAAIAADYLADRQAGGSAIILAHSNKDVAGLNQAIRAQRAEAGELGPSAEINTARGKREFAQGDRLLFLKNDRNLDVKNGTLGTVQKAEDGRLSVMLDSGREVGFAAKDYEHIDHGYAVTVHKAQGVTVDRAYLLATPSMDRSLAYVGMTRHRDAATLYAGGDDFASYDKLARNLSRERPKETTLDFAERHGVDVDESRWTVTKLDPERAQALRDAIAQPPAAAAEGVGIPVPGKTPRLDLSALEERPQAIPAAPEPAAPAKSRSQELMEAQQQRIFAELKARKAASAGNANTADDERRREAIEFAVETQKRSAEKAGKPLSAEDVQGLEKKAAEGFRRDPGKVDQMLKIKELSGKAAARGPSEQGRKPAAFDFEKLREANRQAVSKQEQDRSSGQEQGGPEMDR